LLAEGTFNYADDTNGAVVVVEFETALGAHGNETLSGGADQDAAPASFQLASDGQGGSVVTYVPPSADVAAAGNVAPNPVRIPDVFVFKPDFGNVTIADFNPGLDSIEIDHSIFADAAALLAATHDDGLGNSVVTADAHDTITLLNVTKTQLNAHQGDFHVT
jgi:serralysin